MATEDPTQQKRLAKSVKKDEKWNTMSQEYMMNGLRAKFTQNPSLRNILLRTGTNLLAEASQYDTYWGIGLALESTDKASITNWKGQNNMGKLLIQLREELNPNV